MVRILAALAERDKAVSEVVADARLPLAEAIDTLGKLESLKLVRRVDASDRAMFALEPDGRAILAIPQG